MPTNVFDQPSGQTMGRVNRNLGFNVPAMLQGGMQRGFEDINERKAQARRAFIEDMLTQQLQQAAINAQTRGLDVDTAAKKYHLGQEQEYYQGLHTPQGQAMWKAYQERMGLPAVGDVTNPQQVKNLEGMSHEALGQQQHQQNLAAELLRLHVPIQDQPDPPEIEWARRTLGLTPKEQTQSSTPVKPPPAHSRGAMGVFMHEALPGVAAGGGALGAARMTPGPPWVKGAAAIGGGLLGNRLTQMVQGDLTPDELQEHPNAAAAGDVAGLLSSLLLGQKAYGAAKGRIVAPGQAPKATPSPALSSSVRVRPQSFGQRLQGLLTRPPQPMQAPTYSQPNPNLPPSMGNVPGSPTSGATLPMPAGAVPASTMAPGIRDPAIQRLLNSLFKKQPLGQPVPATNPLP